VPEGLLQKGGVSEEHLRHLPARIAASSSSTRIFALWVRRVAESHLSQTSPSPFCSGAATNIRGRALEKQLKGCDLIVRVDSYLQDHCRHDVLA
jgi:hypothetical protein